MQPGPGRGVRAAAALKVAVGDLPDAVRAFTGRPALATPAARRVAGGALAVVDAAPRRTLMIHDLVHAAEAWPQLPRTLPAFPWQAATLVDELFALLTDLTPGVLEQAARGLTVLRCELEPGREPEPDDEGDKGKKWRLFDAVSGIDENPFTARRRARTAEAHEVTATSPDAWSRRQRRTVEKAVLLHLAALGDAVIRVSEYDPAPLAWTESDAGALAAHHPVPGSLVCLEARLSLQPPDSVELALLRDEWRPAWPNTAQGARRTWHWEVGWSLSFGKFLTWADSAEASRAAAVFAAEQTVAGMCAAPQQVRHDLTGRLLLPRQMLSPADPLLRIVTLRDLMEAMLCLRPAGRPGDEQAADTDSAECWTDVPHSRADGSPASLAVALFDEVGLPYPMPGEDANTRPARDPRFADFLREHAVLLTPSAAGYLAGSDTAGTGERSLRARHEAGLRAVLNVADDEQANLLVADLGPLPDAMAWLDLLDLDALAAFLD